MIFVTDHEAAEVMEPGKQPLDLPSPLIATQHPTVLGGRLAAVIAVRGDQLYALCSQLPIEAIAVISSVPDESLRGLLGEALIESALDKGDFMRVSRRRVRGDWNTSAVCHCHELRTLAPLGLAHGSAPFFAATKVASTKHSLSSSLPRLRKSSASASSTPRSTPERTQCWKRRWQVWYGGKRSGKSCQRAPDRKIHKMPFNTSRSSRRGLPLPSNLRLGFGMSGLMIDHCFSLSSSRRDMPRTYQSIQ